MGYPFNELLTNEYVTKQFNSQFVLVDRAINLANYLVRSGKAVEQWPDNVASEVLRKITEEGFEQVEQEVFSGEEESDAVS